MVTIKDIAKIVASQHNIKVAEAEEFVQKLVDTINEGLETDRLVKIKGFGTFKMQAMKSRASVNVNTGERVIIGEHDRITFLPDAMMKNAINKPFAHFETVEIDDESPLLDEMTPVDDTDDSLDEEQEEIVDEPKVETKEEPKKESKKDVKVEKKVEEKKVTPKKSEPKKPEPKKPEPKKSEPKPVAPEKPVALSIDDDDQESISERMQGSSNVFVGIAAGIFVVIAAIYGFSRYNNATSTPSAQPQTVVVDTVSRDTVKVDTTVVKDNVLPVVENKDTTSVSKKKSRRHGRKYRRHRRRR
jgi:nucleoid DNA-binding protein